MRFEEKLNKDLIENISLQHDNNLLKTKFIQHNIK